MLTQVKTYRDCQGIHFGKVTPPKFKTAFYDRQELVEQTRLETIQSL